MKQDDKKIIIFLYNRFFDALIQGNFWLYINDYLCKPQGGVQFHLITYEDEAFPLTEEQRQLLQQWQSQGLKWTPLAWHSGTGLQSKLQDLIAGFWAVFKLRLKGYRYITTLGSVAGTYAYLYAVVLRLRTFLYQFEPHSEYALDNGMWAESSIVYKASHWLEYRAARFATSIASGTRFMKARVQDEWQSQGEFFQIATVANDAKFTFNNDIREKKRKALGLTDDQWLLFYPGKFGSLYYYEETAWMYRWLSDIEPRLHFLIVTPHDDNEIHKLFHIAGVKQDRYTICHSDYPDIHAYYFAADFAVIAVPPGPSKKFISNIKVGEYLCAGLPYLITKGVSEDYLVADEKKVGVVVDDFVEDAIKNAWPKINEFLEMNADDRRNHCREIGLDYRGFERLNPIFKNAISNLIK